MFELIVATSIAIVISALCSLFEAVLYSVPVSHIETLAQTGHISGRIFQGLRRDVERPIAAILSLNTISHTAGAAVAGAAATAVFGHQWLGYFSAAFTVAILLFSEVIPKTAGVVYSRSLAPFIARPLQLMVWVFWPLIWLTRLATSLVSRGQEEPSVSEEELIWMARLGRQTGTIVADEEQVIQNILALKSKTAHDVMTPRPVVFALKVRLTVAEVRKEVGILAHSRIPVYNEGFEDVVGIVHRRDVLKAIADDRWDVKLNQLLKPVHFVVESTPLDHLLRMFLERRQHLFVVIDEFGGLAGIVTLEDVLEEILGKEIVDEFDQVTDMQELARQRRQELFNDQAQAGARGQRGGARES